MSARAWACLRCGETVGRSHRDELVVTMPGSEIITHARGHVLIVCRCGYARVWHGTRVIVPVTKPATLLPN